MTYYDERLKRFLLLHILFLLATEVCLLASGQLPVPGVFPGGRSNKAPVRMAGRLPRCGEGYSYFRAFMKCDVTLTYCFHYDQKSCVGPDNWGCVHALNSRSGTVMGKKKDASVKRLGLGNSRCCWGRYQSPIDIPVHEAQCVPQVPTLTYSSPSKQLLGFLENNGVYPEFRVNFLDYDNPLLLKNVPFTCVVPGSSLYVLSSVQVHVGMKGRKGSEHKLHGRSFDGELHLVHVRRDFWKPSTSKAGGRPSKVNLRCASQTPLGLTIIAIFLSVSDGEKNEELDAFLSAYNIQVIQRSKEICPFDEICHFPRGKLTPTDGSDNDGLENVLGNDDVCSGPEMAEDEAVVAILQKKLKGGNPASESRHFVLIAGNNQSSVNAIRDIINRLRKRRRKQTYQVNHDNDNDDVDNNGDDHNTASLDAPERRHGKVSMSRNKQVLCFCRQRRYMELYQWYAGRGEEVECRQKYGDTSKALHPKNVILPLYSRRTHYSRLPERTEEETNKKGRDSRAWFRMRPGRLLPRFSDYYQYFGSLTSPPCSEVVNWIVMKQPLKITTEQLTALHQLQSREAGTLLRTSGNARPTLPLNGRLVTTNGPSC